MLNWRCSILPDKLPSFFKKSGFNIQDAFTKGDLINNLTQFRYLNRMRTGLF